MTTIEFTSATWQFPDAVHVGEYVAWWVSDDRQSSLPMTFGSHDPERYAAAAHAAKVVLGA